MISISLFYCCENVFTHMTTWMIRKRVCKDFEINNLGEYHDFHVQSDTLLLADVFENFQNKCLEYMN